MIGETRNIKDLKTGEDISVEVVSKIDTSRHDSRFRQRVEKYGGLYKVKNAATGEIYTAYGFELNGE